VADDAMKQKIVAQVRILARLAKSIFSPGRSAGANGSVSVILSQCSNDAEKNLA
jgi:hypothetical protein